MAIAPCWRGVHSGEAGFFLGIYQSGTCFAHGVRMASSKKKRSTKKSGRKVGARKTSKTRRSSSKASKKVGRSMHEMKRGQLRSGRSGKKVTSRKQAIAIGLSEARREGANVPPPRKKSAARKKTSKRAGSSTRGGRGRAAAR
jgi:hypothetical protein